MSIESTCQGCGRRLRVDDRYAGCQARCPHCRSVYTVPGGESNVDESSAGQDLWRLQTEMGQEFGPISKQEIGYLGLGGTSHGGSVVESRTFDELGVGPDDLPHARQYRTRRHNALRDLSNILDESLHFTCSRLFSSAPIRASPSGRSDSDSRPRRPIVLSGGFAGCLGARLCRHEGDRRWADGPRGSLHNAGRHDPGHRRIGDAVVWRGCSNTNGRPQPCHLAHSLAMDIRGIGSQPVSKKNNN